jgi:hypothetical protein
MRKMSSQFTWIWTMLILFACGAAASGQPPYRTGGVHADAADAASMATTSIPFQGAARGGELILAEALNRNMRVAIIPTRRGESAASVAGRLAQFINENNPFEWPIPAGFPAVQADGGILHGLPGTRLTYILAGTETGLGIPRPPTALTCTHDAAGHALLLDWDNPPAGYDEIGIVYNWSNFDHRGGDTVAGEATSFAVDLDDRPLNLEDLDIWVIGFRKGLPSNAAAIHVSGNALQELSGVPFTDGVAPNWVGWSQSGTAVFSQRTRPEHVAGKGRPFNAIKTAGTKPFQQVLEFGPGGGVGGMSRKFNGLIPGHTYRVTMRVAVEELEPSGAVSVHACAHESSALTADQLARTDRAEVVSGAGAIAAGAGFVSQSMDITLPSGARNLTVWVCCRAGGSTRVVSDWLSLEDQSG